MPAPSTTPRHVRIPTPLLFGVFVLSGISALLYQMIWQRSLLTLYGSNVESVAMVVSAFMLGLGLGSLAGGWLSKRLEMPLVVLFAVAELGIGLYGLVSLHLFHWVGDLTVGAGTVKTGLLAFALVLLPTLLMGATLPLLVAHQVNTTGSVGRSVSWLYFVNTLGAALGAYLSAFWVLGRFGQSGSVQLAAALNATVAVVILLTWLRGGKSSPPPEKATISPAPPSAPASPLPSAGAMSFQRVLWIAALSGFLALSWEILWARLYNYVTASRAPAFGAMLGSYLLGLALGSLLSMRWQRRESHRSVASLGWLVLGANILAFLVVPVASWLVVWLPEHLWLAGGIDFGSWMQTLPLVMVASALQGTILPLLCHVAIPADRSAGQRLSYVYLANIVGSGAGSLLTGFVLLEWLTAGTVGMALLLAAPLLAWMCLGRTATVRHGLAAAAVAAVAVAAPSTLLSGVWERLYYKQKYDGQRFPFTQESRHGVVNVDTQDVVYGNGAYDGQIGTSLTAGDWHVRPYFLSAVHENPRRVLVIGVSAGAWTQILANHPQVEHIDAVEISHAYLDVIAKFPAVASILTDPKVHLHIDDGRRWLKRHPDARYDAIVMNTTHHWREFASSLLSEEFLTLARSHLAPGGVVMWNCTSSGRAAKTGMDVFPHTMMCLNNCIGSMEPLVVDKARWRRILTEYRSGGRPLFDPADAKSAQELDDVVSLADREGDPPPDDFDGFRWWIVGRERMERLWGDERPITDDNLGHEY